MKNDPIVDQARRAGEEYLARFNFDLGLACDDLRRRTEEARLAGRTVISRPAKRINPASAPTKKAG
jgi:hypothetical protein